MQLFATAVRTREKRKSRTTIKTNVAQFVAFARKEERLCTSSIAIAIPLATSAVLCQTLISFGGICIILQSYTYLKDCGISFGRLMFFKGFQASLSALLTFLICTIF